MTSQSRSNVKAVSRSVKDVPKPTRSSRLPVRSRGHSPASRSSDQSPEANKRKADVRAKSPDAARLRSGRGSASSVRRAGSTLEEKHLTEENEKVTSPLQRSVRGVREREELRYSDEWQRRKERKHAQHTVTFDRSALAGDEGDRRDGANAFNMTSSLHGRSGELSADDFRDSVEHSIQWSV